MNCVPWWIKVCVFERCRYKYAALEADGSFSHNPSGVITAVREGIVGPKNEDALGPSNLGANLGGEALAGIKGSIEPYVKLERSQCCCDLLHTRTRTSLV